ncbi:MAG: hypothetical protein NVS9B4_04620 [Candidatus Acidiferrum sp.]
MTRCGVARAALKGEPRAELVREVLETLTGAGIADRIGVWVELASSEGVARTRPASLRGLVWDRENGNMPAEWAHLSLEAPLPYESLSEGKSVEQGLDGAELPLIGPLVELRRALWVPIERTGRLCGVLLAGKRTKHGAMPRDLLEAVAAELALGIELEGQQSVARERYEDIAITRQTLRSLARGEGAEEILSDIAKNCTAAGDRWAGVGAAFVVIGVAHRGKHGSGPETVIDFCWGSGDARWVHTVETEPLAGLWRQALETRGIAGTDPPGIAGAHEVSPAETVERIVAIPLEAAGEVLGVLIAGLHHAEAPLAMLERLELRAALASTVLAGMASRATSKAKAADQPIREEHEAQELSEAHGNASGIIVQRHEPGRDEMLQENRVDAEIQGVLDCLEEGVVFFDAQDQVRFWNVPFAQMAGLAAEDLRTINTLEKLIRRMQEQVAEPESFAKRWREVSRGIDGGVGEELRLRQPALRVLERSARRLSSGRDLPLGRVEIYRDITAQRDFQSKLLHTEKLAALGQTVTGVAHELSSPLTSIMGYAQRMLARENGSHDCVEAREISQEAERAVRILRQLLLNGHEERPERRLVALNAVVLRAMELQRSTATDERIRVLLDLDPNLASVYGDAGQLQQVVLNLTGNARQAIEQKGAGGSIRVRTKQVGKNRALLEVADDGPGIPQAILTRIFDPFFTTKPAGTGTGLGLSIVMGIVREHGGQLNVVSPPGGGAIFSISLEAVTEDPEKTEGHFPRHSAGSVGQQAHEAVEELTGVVVPALNQSRSAPHILVVEDEPIVARLISDVLKDEGCRVDVVLSVSEAMLRARRQDYDLVICDMRMPALDGQHFYNALVRDGNSLCERFLFVTGDVIAGQAHGFLQRNDLPHLAKPFRVEELQERVRGLLKRHGKVAHSTAAVGKSGGLSV